MNRKKIIFWILMLPLLAVLAVIFLVAGYYLYIAGAYYYATKEPEQKFIEFQTVTIEVEFPSSKLKNIFGYSPDKLSDLAVEKICPKIIDEFEEEVIGCGRYNKPYTFSSNPMNLALVIEVWQHGDKFHLTPMVERSCYVQAKSMAKHSDYFRQKYDAQMQAGWPENHAIKCVRIPPPDRGPAGYQKALQNRVQDEQQMMERLDDIADEVISKMEPQADIAAKFESEVKNSRNLRPKESE
ncbi:MAG: hypothetical protein ACAH80_08810 [Alphaproteobacteria bacterium]